MARVAPDGDGSGAGVAADAGCEGNIQITADNGAGPAGVVPTGGVFHMGPFECLFF